jgi:kumamolisin
MSSIQPTDPNELASRELTVKAAELRVRQLEASKALSAARSPWWRRADPLVLAIFAGALTLLGNILQERSKATDDLALEQAKARYNLVLQAMATNDAATAKRNIHFFIDAGLLEDKDCKIRDAIDQDQPVLPSLSGIAPTMLSGLHSAAGIARLYNFPSGLDGRGQVIGILEFGGSVVTADLADYFNSLNLPTPDVTAVPIDGVNSQSNINLDSQVMLDVEIIGTIAPRAHIRVYFAPFTASGFADAVRQAAADQVTVLSNGWGKSEDDWQDEELKIMDAALEMAAKQGITVLAAAGDRGVTDGALDHHRHVDFPASSPWVLSIGGTSLTAQADRITSEVVWKDSSGQSATGGGVSDKFARPNWQSTVSVPVRDDRGNGRGVPDVVASASPDFGVGIIVHGKVAQLGGTSASVPLWAGLIALVNQAIGYDIGYINPRLYREMGPAGLFNTITEGDNSVDGVRGYMAGRGWSPVAGWGSPNGMKLVTWLIEHPDSRAHAMTSHTNCGANTR